MVLTATFTAVPWIIILELRASHGFLRLKGGDFGPFKVGVRTTVACERTPLSLAAETGGLADNGRCQDLIQHPGWR